MKSNAVRDLLLSFSLIGGHDYENIPIFDNEVDECLMNMYFYMMCNSVNEDKKQEYFNEFEKSYNKLNDEQKEIVKKDYLDIMEAQNKNKEKVKKKGMINYE